MSSRSSNSAPEGRLPIGRVRGHRGGAGELTVRVASGDAAQWTGLRRVWVHLRDEERPFDVEHCRAYSDRLVLKLRGIDDPGAAEELRGGAVVTSATEAPALEAGSYYAAELVGMSVTDTSGGELGRVREILPTGGADVLVVAAEGGDELLIPLAHGIVLHVDVSLRCIRVRPPEGLLDLNVAPSSAETTEGGRS